MKTHLPVIAIWMFYLVGQFIHIWVKAWLVVVSPKAPLIPTYREYVRRYSAPLVARLFAATLFFMAFEFGAGYADALFPGFLPSGGNVWVRAAMAGTFGLAADSIIEKITSRLPIGDWMKGWLPDPPQ